MDSHDFIGNGGAAVWFEPWVEQAELAIRSLDLELSDVERESGGLLRISIDCEQGVTVSHCERVSHHLSHLLAVENVSYERLEVSSPGVDRPLKRRRDFERFEGHEVSIRLKKSTENQKNFQGVLHRGEGAEYCLNITGDLSEAGQQLNFDLADLSAARLVPHLKF